LTRGDLNGATKLFSVAFQATQQAFAFSLTTILNTFSDPSGGYIVCDIKTGEKLFTLANIYASNEDDPNFLKQVFDHLHDFSCEEIILGGDFNLVLDVKEDKKLPKCFENNQSKFNLTDIWRTWNADKHRYTWLRKKP